MSVVGTYALRLSGSGSSRTRSSSRLLQSLFSLRAPVGLSLAILNSGPAYRTELGSLSSGLRAIADG